ncbi:MAG: hypothetical protein LBR25_01515 [Erysipelotrichaceae bacterium]|jgi:hypothetical protein|nr:hypothetical protein [Erysipelotrichaceae bacterium]
MGKSKTVEKATASQKKKERFEQSVARQQPMLFHKVLIVIKFLFAFMTIYNFMTSFGYPEGFYRTVSQVFYVLMIFCLVNSLFMHDAKKGVYFFIAYFVFEYLFYFWPLLDQKNFSQSLIDQAVTYLLGSLFIVIAVVVYYKKRWAILK